jgi:hypothetical protein
MRSRSKDDLVARRDQRAGTVEDSQAEGDDALSVDEERFVAAFVEYWTRRGAQIVRTEA